MAYAPSLPVSRLDDARAAYDVLQEVWRALADDDEATLERVSFPASRQLWGFPAGGLADGLRSAMGVTQDQCRSMGTSHTVRVLGADDLGFFCKTIPWGGPEVLGAHGPERVFGWSIVMHRSDGLWLLWGAASDEEMRAAAEQVEIPAPEDPTVH
jgi:hypothetical protein